MTIISAIAAAIAISIMEIFLEELRIQSENADEAAVLNDDTYKAITARLDELDILIKGYQNEYRRLSNILMRRKV